MINHNVKIILLKLFFPKMMGCTSISCLSSMLNLFTCFFIKIFIHNIKNLYRTVVSKESTTEMDRSL